MKFQNSYSPFIFWLSVVCNVIIIVVWSIIHLKATYLLSNKVNLKKRLRPRGSSAQISIYMCSSSTIYRLIIFGMQFYSIVVWLIRNIKVQSWQSNANIPLSVSLYLPSNKLNMKKGFGLGEVLPKFISFKMYWSSRTRIHHLFSDYLLYAMLLLLYDQS